MNKKDILKLETREKIKDIFIEIYKSKPINKITVKEITDKLGLNRGTFYLHFIDIYDVLEEVENEFINDIFNFINKAITSKDKIEEIFINPNDGFVQVLKYFKYRRKYSEALFKENSSFVRKLREYIKKIFISYITEKNLGVVGIDSLNIEYILFGNLGIIIYWIENGMELDESKLADKLYQFIFNGPLNIKYTI